VLEAAKDKGTRDKGTRGDGFKVTSLAERATSSVEVRFMLHPKWRGLFPCPHLLVPLSSPLPLKDRRWKASTKMIAGPASMISATETSWKIVSH